MCLTIHRRISSQIFSNFNVFYKDDDTIGWSLENLLADVQGTQRESFRLHWKLAKSKVISHKACQLQICTLCLPWAVACSCWQSHSARHPSENIGNVQLFGRTLTPVETDRRGHHHPETFICEFLYMALSQAMGYLPQATASALSSVFCSILRQAFCLLSLEVCFACGPSCPHVLPPIIKKSCLEFSISLTPS